MVAALTDALPVSLFECACRRHLCRCRVHASPTPLSSPHPFRPASPLLFTTHSKLPPLPTPSFSCPLFLPPLPPPSSSSPRHGVCPHPGYRPLGPARGAGRGLPLRLCRRGGGAGRRAEAGGHDHELHPRRDRGGGGQGQGRVGAVWQDEQGGGCRLVRARGGWMRLPEGAGFRVVGDGRGERGGSVAFGASRL